MKLDPDPTRALNIDRVRAKVKDDVRAGRKIIPYWSRLHFVARDENKVNPDAARMRGKWAVKPNHSGPSRLVMYRASCRTSWADYLVWCVDQWGSLMRHIDGVYIDEVQPVPDTNTATRGGYQNPSGGIRPTYEILGTRDLLKRINWLIWRARGANPLSVAHCSATHVMPAISHCTFMLIGEQYYSGYFRGRRPEFLPPTGSERPFYYSYALPMDRLRAEGYWKQWGAVTVWLPCLKDQRDIMQNPVTTRDMLSRVM